MNECYSGVQIYEQEKNLRRSMQQGISTPYNTLFLAKSSAEDLSNSIFGLKSVWRWAEAYCCTCDREWRDSRAESRRLQSRHCHCPPRDSPPCLQPQAIFDCRARRAVVTSSQAVSQNMAINHKHQTNCLRTYRQPNGEARALPLRSALCAAPVPAAAGCSPHR